MNLSLLKITALIFLVRSKFDFYIFDNCFTKNRDCGSGHGSGVLSYVCVIVVEV